MEPLLVSIRDAATLLGLGKTKIYGLIGDGKLDAKKLGRRTLISIASIRKLAEEGLDDTSRN